MDIAELVRRFRVVPAVTANLRRERRAAGRELAGAPRVDVLALADGLIRSGVARFVAYEIVLHHKPALEGLTRAEVESLGRGMSHWGDVDSFALFVAGPAWRAGRISDAEVRGWARSQDWWWRRTALVSTVALNSKARGGDGGTGRYARNLPPAGLRPA